MDQTIQNMDDKLERKLEAFQDRCRQKGLRVTPQRLEVYKALVGMESHPTAEDVYVKVREHLGNISFDTVNRTLMTLTEMGVAFIVEGTGQPRRFDGGLEDHQHFRCIRCGKIVDFHHAPFDHIHTPPELDPNYQVLRKTVYFEGLCGNCGNNNNNRFTDEQ